MKNLLKLKEKLKTNNKIYACAFFLLPFLIASTIIGFHSNELINKPLHLLSIFLLICMSISMIGKTIQIIKAKRKTKKTFSKYLCIILIILEWLGASICLFLLYGPRPNFRTWLIPTAMTTMNHRYFATWFYSADEIAKVLEENRVIENNEDANLDLIQIEEEQPEEIIYENEFERQVLEKENETDIYKIIPISEKNFKGFLAVIYDPSRIFVETTNYLENRGQYVTEMAANAKARLAINGGGFVDPNYNSSGGSPQGITIKNEKIITDREYAISGGLIGFTKENKLILGRMSSKEAIKKGVRDAVSFGPFLIVNGKKSFIKGNGGWGTAPRTAIAQRQDGIVLFLAVEGRKLKNPGANMVDLTNILSNYGAINAANLDGGTSTVMVLPQEEALKYLTQEELKSHCRKNYCHINDPIDSTGAHATRPVASAFVVK